MFCPRAQSLITLDLLDCREKSLGNCRISGQCKVGGSVRSQFFTLFALTVARMPCYEMNRAYTTGLRPVGL